MNWIRNRGYECLAEATIPSDIIKNVLRLNIDYIIALHTKKILIGSSIAGTIGGIIVMQLIY